MNACVYCKMSCRFESGGFCRIWGASGLAWGKLQRAAAVQGLGGSGVTDPGYRVGDWAGALGVLLG